MEKETKFYNGRLYMQTENGDLKIVPMGMDDARIKTVQGELDVVEIEGQKYVTRDYKFLRKMTPELEQQVYDKGDLEDIIGMNTNEANSIKESKEVIRESR